MNATFRDGLWFAAGLCLGGASLCGEDKTSLAQEVQGLTGSAAVNETTSVGVALPKLNPVPPQVSPAQPAPPVERDVALVATTRSDHWLSDGMAALEKEESVRDGKKGPRDAELQLRPGDRRDSRLYDLGLSRKDPWATETPDRRTAPNLWETKAPLLLGNDTKKDVPLNRFESPKAAVNPYLDAPALPPPQATVTRPDSPRVEPQQPVPPPEPAPSTPVLEADKYFPQLKR